MSSEPTEAELLRRAIENRLLDVHTSLPAVVEKYDSSTQTIDARVALKRAIASDDQATVYEEIPILRNIRVKFPSGSHIFGETKKRFYIAWPLQKGDPVDLIFDEEYTGDYRETATVPSAPVFAGRFNLSSCYALPGAGANQDAITDIGVNDSMILGIENGVQIRITSGEAGDQIQLGPSVTSPVALSNPLCDILSFLIHTIKTATASGTETGLAAIIAALNAHFGSVPEVSNTDIGATKAFAE